MPSPDKFSLSQPMLEKLGFPIEQICQRAGVSWSNAWITDDFFRLWAAADEALSDRSAGLRLGADGIARGYSVASIVALHAPDFRQALATLSRYKRLTCPELVEVEIAGEEAIVRYRWLQATGEVPRLLVDTTMASLRALARQGSAGKIAPIRLELARRPMDHALLSRHFECQIIFGAATDAMVFERAALDVSFTTADGGAFANVLAGLESQVSAGEGFSALVGELRVATARQLSEGHGAPAERGPSPQYRGSFTPAPCQQPHPAASPRSIQNHLPATACSGAAPNSEPAPRQHRARYGRHCHAARLR